jgi:hypothetical protein
MIAHSELLVNSAVDAGIDIPDDLDNYEPSEYLRWHIFCVAQLGSRQPYAGCHIDNAKIIAGIPESELSELNMDDLISKGFVIGRSN